MDKILDEVVFQRSGGVYLCLQLRSVCHFQTNDELYRIVRLVDVTPMQPSSTRELAINLSPEDISDLLPFLQYFAKTGDFPHNEKEAAA